MNNRKHYNSIAVIGAGAWGTAISATLSKNQKSIGIWAKERKVVDSINLSNENVLDLKFASALLLTAVLYSSTKLLARD